LKANFSNPIDVYLEVGKKRIFASAIDWPGWCRSGRDEESSLRALFDYGLRYAGVLQPSGLFFNTPADASVFTVVERLKGDATTDFGAPGAAPSSDARPVDDNELQHLTTLLKACWVAFDNAVKASTGKELTKGPRGGGRDLQSIVQHVLDAESAYLSKIGGKFKKGEEEDPFQELNRMRKTIMLSLAAAARSELPAQGPRGGIYWTPRYFVRRSAWHVLDHTWEIENRAT
jgi:hypothetical protein